LLVTSLMIGALVAVAGPIGFFLWLLVLRKRK
jgi:hypothetical protein